MAELRPFHLAVPVGDLDAARSFYVDVIGCGTGRSAPRWLDLDFFGHQVTLHLLDGHDAGIDTNTVDGDEVPARHFGLVLEREVWQALADRLSAAEVEFLVEPHVRFPGEAGEQATMFVRDPSGNALEFKSLADPRQLFAR